MGKTRRVRDGSGPHRDSRQRRQSGSTGRRRQAGQKCPKKK